MELIYIVLIGIILLGFLALLYVTRYNKLMEYKTKLDHAEAVIDESLRNKFDLIKLIDNELQVILNTNKSYFPNLKKIEDENISNFDFDRELVESFIILNRIVSDYDEVENNKKVKKILRSSQDIDEKLNAAKIYFNKVTDFNNNYLVKFPTNIVAKIHGMKIRSYYDGKNMQDEIVDDFKM